MSAAETQLQKRPGKRIIVSEDLPLTMLTAVASTLVINAAGLDREFVYVGVALSPFVADVIKNAVAGLRKRWLMLLTGLLVLFGQTGRAVAARLKARRDWPISWVSIAATTGVSAVLTVAVFTVPELARGQALLADRGATFLPVSEDDDDGGSGVVDVRRPVLVVPSGLVVSAEGPVPVSYAVTAHDDVDRRVAPICKPRSGTVFPLGETRVECSAADDAGNRAAATFSVTVEESDVPIALTLPNQVEVEASGADGARVGFRARAADQSGEALAVRCEPASGTVFAIGTTRVTCTATDAQGRSSSGRFRVVVEDRTSPALTLPQRLPVKTADERGQRVFFDITATDAVDGEMSATCEPASGSNFRPGTTEVSCRATDAHGNRADGIFTVEVAIADVRPDTVRPELALPAEIDREASAPQGAVVRYDAQATDAVDGDVPAHCDPASGSTFAIASTTVRCTARDSAGNTRTGTFVVTIADTTAPVMTVPRALSAEAASRAGAVIEFRATARDAVGGARTVTCEPLSGSTFPLGQTVVRCSARDSSGNSATERFRVAVVDTRAPELMLPSDQTVEATSADGAVVRFEARAEDAVGGASTPRCTPAPGLFGFGKTVVTCAAADKHGNRATGTFSVGVVDTQGPRIFVPDGLPVEATSDKGALVRYVVRAEDAVSGAVGVSCDPKPGIFGIGQTTVTCSAADERGNASQVTFTVSVADTTAPRIEVPKDFVVGGFYRDVIRLDYTTSASDDVDGKIEPTCSPRPGTRYVIGEWLERKVAVECVAADRSGNEATGGFTVTIRRIVIR